MLRGSIRKEKIARRYLRDLSDCVNLSDTYLLKNCGVSRAIYHQLLRILEPVVPKSQRSTGIPFPLKVLGTLNVYLLNIHTNTLTSVYRRSRQ